MQVPLLLLFDKSSSCESADALDAYICFFAGHVSQGEAQAKAQANRLGMMNKDRTQEHKPIAMMHACCMCAGGQGAVGPRGGVGDGAASGGPRWQLGAWSQHHRIHLQVLLCHALIRNSGVLNVCLLHCLMQMQKSC